MLLEEAADAEQLRLRQPDATPEAADENDPSLPPQPVAAVVTDDRPRRRGGDDEEDVEVPTRGERGGGDERGFPRKRDAEALQPDQDDEERVAVPRDEVSDVS